MFKVKRMPANDEKCEPVAVENVSYIDGEVMALHECLRQLEPLDTPARARVFAYLYQRLGPELPKASD